MRFQTVLSSGALLAFVTASAYAGSPKPVPPDAIERISQAVPKQATVKPQKPRKLLVFNLANGFAHGSIPYGAKAMELMGQATGAYEAVLSYDIAMFEPETLKQFDAVFMNNTTGRLFLPKNVGKLPADEQKKAQETEARLKKSLLDFVSGGKGLIGSHAATDCSYEWAAYGAMMGGYFWGHPWSEKVGIKIEEPDHPLSAAFGGKDFQINDEIYQFRAPYSRDCLRVLMTIDPANTNMHKSGLRRADGDFAVTWIKNHGKGRVFYCSLGHRNEVFWNTAVLKHFLDGIQFAFGDLEADATPSGDQRPFAALFDGASLAAFDFKPGGWVVEDGTMALKRRGGYLWTKQTYGNFILDLEFKVSKGANSGIFIRTANKGNPVQTGMEVQVLDSYGKAKVGKHDCGAIYDCVAPSKNAVKKPGEWNRFEITCYDNKINAVLNSQPIIDMDLDRWTKARQNPDGSRNKFGTAYKDLARAGHIGFQDHGNPVWFRNVTVLPLNRERKQLLDTLAKTPKETRLPSLLTSLASAKTRKERNNVEAVLVATARRIGNEAERAKMISAALEGAATPVRVSLLRMMGRLGTSSLLPTVKSALKDRNPEIQTAAIQGLAEWPDASVAGELLQVVKSSAAAPHKSLALRGYIRMASMPSQRTEQETLKMLDEAMKAASTPAEKKLVIEGMSNVSGTAALAALEPYLADKTLQADAGTAVIKVAKAIGAHEKDTAEAALRMVADTIKDQRVKKSAIDAIEQMHQFEDYVVAWLFSGPYKHKDRNKLLSVPFAPEVALELPGGKGAAEGGNQKAVQWRPVKTEKTPQKSWYVDLNRIARGGNCAAYLRTWVRSPKAQKARLEAASDDGLKVWLNGKMIHEKNVWRGIKAGDDKIDADLKEGWNSLILKVSQGGGHWAGGARIRDAKGGGIQGLILPGSPQAIETALKDLAGPNPDPEAAGAALNAVLAFPKNTKDVKGDLAKIAAALKEESLRQAARKATK